MRGGHDLGGQQDMGPIDPESEAQEPVFHAEWERRVFALTLAAGMLGEWNIDESRHARERQDPLAYLRNSYYENWLEGLEKLLVEKGLIAAEELQAGVVAAPQSDSGTLSVPSPEAAEKILYAGASSLMPAESEPLFCVGDRVKLREVDTAGHTRAPRYARGATGAVASLRGCHSFPDGNAAGAPQGQHLYTVAFRAQELWDAGAADSEVLIDLWEPYLEGAAS